MYLFINDIFSKVVNERHIFIRSAVAKVVWSNRIFCAKKQTLSVHFACFGLTTANSFVKRRIATPLPTRIIDPTSFIESFVCAKTPLSILPTTSENVRIKTTRLAGAYLRDLYHVNT